MNQARTLLRPMPILASESLSAPTAVATTGRLPEPAPFTRPVSTPMSWRSSRSQESSGYEMPAARGHASPGSTTSMTTTFLITRTPHSKTIFIKYPSRPFRLFTAEHCSPACAYICSIITLQGLFWLRGRSSAPRPFYPSTFRLHFLFATAWVPSAFFILFFCITRYVD